ncbi:MAG: hypothetical protein MUC98_08990, partial [Desulfobacterota bacterium]|nr:hypothetical protein [Thermodesulfobacteriota bacterium]
MFTFGGNGEEEFSYSDFDLPRRDLIGTLLPFIATPVLVLLTLSDMPGLGRGFRDSNWIPAKGLSKSWGVLRDGLLPGFHEPL